jgi:hypothetical protein
LKHQRQEKAYWCGNACLAMLLDKSQAEMARLVKTRVSGTSHGNVLNYLLSAKIPHHSVRFDNPPSYNELWWIEAVSKKHALYLSCEIRDRHFKNGRDRVRYHAVLAVDGLFYDPSNFQPQPFDAYCATFNKNLYLRSMIVFGDERPNYLSHEED